MITVSSITLAERSITEQGTGIVSLINIIEEIRSPVLPARLPRMVISIGLHRESEPEAPPEPIELRIMLKIPTGDEIQIAQLSVTVRSFSHRLTFLMNEPSFAGAGVHRFRVDRKQRDDWVPTVWAPLAIYRTEPVQRDAAETPIRCA